MLWNLIVDADKSDELTVSITVEASNWFNALREGLSKYGVDSRVLSHISCDVSPDRSVRVLDSLTNRIFLLKPVAVIDGVDVTPSETSDPFPTVSSLSTDDGEDAPSGGLTSSPRQTAALAEHVESASEKPSDVATPTPKEEFSTSSPATKGGMPEHRIFFSRDEVPDQALGIHYLERLIAVSSRLSKETLVRLARHHFDELRHMDASRQTMETMLFVTVHVYDHEFEKRAERPAMVALTWKEWRSEEPEILFPLFGDEGATVSRKRSASDARAGETPNRREVHLEPVAPPSAAASTLSPEKRRAAPAIDIENKMVIAFERMQDIYAVRDHDRAAEFVLSLATKLIPCEAGSAMLMSPGNFELYVAAAYGPVADQLLNRKMSLTNGIVGFATRNAMLVSVSNPAADPRFDEDLDRETGYVTRNVLCAPVQYEGATIGAVELLNRFDGDGFTETDGNVLSYLCTSFAEYVVLSLPSREADFTDREFLALESKKRPARKRAAAKGARPKAAASKGKPKGRSAAPSGPARTAAVSTKGKTQKKAKGETPTKKGRASSGRQ